MVTTVTQNMESLLSTSLVFSDSKGCRRWLARLPVTNIPLAQEALSSQLQYLSRAEIAPIERAKIAETLRETVLFVHSELYRRFANKALPFGTPEAQAWQQARGLWQALWQQYSACLQPLLEGDPALSPWAAHVLQRGLYVGKQLVLCHALARRSLSHEFWLELHAYYRFAEMLECTTRAVKDRLQPNTVAVSCHSTYSHALLLAMIDSEALTSRQIELANRWLESWSRKVHLQPKPPISTGPIYYIDLKQPHGLCLIESSANEASETTRYGSIDKLAVSLQQRIKRLRAGSSPAELGLGTDCTNEASLFLLMHLHEAWCTVKRPTAISHTAEEEVSLCGGGLAGVFFRVSGKSFSPQQVGERMSFTGTQIFSTLDLVADYDPDREQAERNYPWEQWRLIPAAVTTYQRTLGGNDLRWQLEQLVVLKRTADKLSCGYINWLGQAGETELLMHIAFWPVEPQAVTLLPTGSLLKQEATIPALLIPAYGAEGTTLILPPRSFISGRRLHTRGPAVKEIYRLTKLVQRGADFERIAFEIDPA